MLKHLSRGYSTKQCSAILIITSSFLALQFNWLERTTDNRVILVRVQVELLRGYRITGIRRLCTAKIRVRFPVTPFLILNALWYNGYYVTLSMLKSRFDSVQGGFFGQVEKLVVSRVCKTRPSPACGFESHPAHFLENSSIRLRIKSEEY